MRSSSSLSQADYETLAEFRYQLRLFLRFSEDAAHEAGITPQQHQALLAIKGFPREPHLTIGALAERLQLRHHSTVGLIDRLVEEKLAARLPSPEDRRKVVIRLTARGEKILEKLSFAHRRQLKQLKPELLLLLNRLDAIQSARTSN